MHNDINFRIAEVDECKSDNHGCEHRCINKIGGYECECDIGYSLQSDGKTCQGMKFFFIFINILPSLARNPLSSSSWCGIDNGLGAAEAQRDVHS